MLPVDGPSFVTKPNCETCVKGRDVADVFVEGVDDAARQAPVIRLLCGHPFHVACLAEKLLDLPEQACPSCRRPISQYDIEVINGSVTDNDPRRPEEEHQRQQAGAGLVDADRRTHKLRSIRARQLRQQQRQLPECDRPLPARGPVRDRDEQSCEPQRPLERGAAKHE